MKLVKPVPWIVALLPCGAFPSGPLAAELPQWPLQHQPGPDGDPRQDRATLPEVHGAAPEAAEADRRRRSPLSPTPGTATSSSPAGGSSRRPARWPAPRASSPRPGSTPPSWLDATVPGTVLTTLVDQGVYPEPTYGLNNMAIPESLNREDYWYRTEFTPSARPGRTNADPDPQRRQLRGRRVAQRRAPRRDPGRLPPGRLRRLLAGPRRRAERARRAHLARPPPGHPPRGVAEGGRRAQRRRDALRRADLLLHRGLGLDPRHPRPGRRHLAGRRAARRRPGQDRRRPGRDRPAAARHDDGRRDRQGRPREPQRRAAEGRSCAGSSRA